MNSKMQWLGVALFGLWLAADQPARAQGLTFTTNTYPVGTSPRSVTVADVNGDGYPDLISANSGANSLTVLTNNGGGIFGLYATVQPVTNPVFVATASLNGTGKPALICANGNNGTLTVVTNNGSGIFGSNATLQVYGNPYSLAVINVSGSPELICANNNNQLIVFTYTPAGGFFPHASLGVGTAPEYLLAADVNGDGSPDLITVNNGDDTLSVLTNNGSGVFSTASTPQLAPNAGPVWVVALDIYGTGKVELVSANAGNNTLTILTNGGFGQFGSNATINLPSTPTSLATADFNGDGEPDLAVAQTINSVLVLTNNGAGGFGSNTVVNFRVPQLSLAAMPINSSGLYDLITANYTANELTVLTQNGVGRPLLKLTHPGLNSFVLTWVSPSTNFILQTNNNLATTNWFPANLPVTTASGTNQSTLNPAPPGKLFFRLKQ